MAGVARQAPAGAEKRAGERAFEPIGLAL